jgi:hypothetical protein
LLPGSYTVIFSVDGKAFPYALSVPAQPPMGEIVRVNETSDAGRTQKPLSFDGRALTPSEGGASAFVGLPAPGEVTWIVRRGSQVMTKSETKGSEYALFQWPSHLEPGTYELEARYGSISRNTEFVVGKAQEASDSATLLSFNANLRPALRWSFVGHQWLLRNKIAEARRCLKASLALGVTKEAEVELARAEALAGEWDAGRDRVRRILTVQPNDFEALSVLAYIETQLQDYSVAAELYRRALALQDSPALRLALAKLPPGHVAN